MRIVLAAAAALALANCAASPAIAPPTNQASHTVKLVLPSGHGSGVHIGNGYIVTAAHVVGGETGFTLKSSAGDVQKGAVLWASKTYDIALVRAERPARLAAAKLACRDATVGETVTAEGNPATLEFVTAYGAVAGAPREMGPWKSAFVVDGTIVMGMSGGGVFDAKGNVVGIAVGVMSVPVGFGASLTGFGAVVPSSVVCELMGRA
jgi:S1-C subfamily serine protease